MQDMLRQAMELGRAGRSDAAAGLLRDILATVPGQPDALQLLGMLARSRGANEEAAAFFRQSLDANRGQPNVLNNLGNALLDLGRRPEALTAYREALALDPAYGEARTNLGLALLASDDAGGACETLGEEVRRDPGNGKAWSALGRALRANGRLDEGITAFQTALSLRPGHVPTMHNLAVAIRLAGRPGEALPLFERCAAADPGSAETRFNLGHGRQDLGQFEEAAAAYLAAIEVRPNYRDAHDSLNRLYWQTGNSENYLKSYIAALQAHPDDAGLLADLAHRFNLGGRANEAIALLTPALARGVDTAELRHRLGQALWAEGQAEAALAQFAAARGLDPENGAVARETARSLIVLERYDEALDLLEDDTTDQQAIAYRGLSWSFLGDARAGRLNDYERFISSEILEPPSEYGNVATFNARLEAVLAGLHTMSQHPLEQTLRGGTQTMDDLFDRKLPEIQAVRAMIEEAVARYVAALPQDAGHLFLRRKSAGFAFSGSWSVRLRRSGFHMNHVHPEGWISSCYYVGLPAAVDTAQGNQGWLKFGETALGLGARERIARLVRPEVGRLVLFPSYFYHGTIPFDEEAHRTTIAFDVIPA